MVCIRKFFFLFLSFLVFLFHYTFAHSIFRFSHISLFTLMVLCTIYMYAIMHVINSHSGIVIIFRFSARQFGHYRCSLDSLDFHFARNKNKVKISCSIYWSVASLVFRSTHTLLLQFKRYFDVVTNG